LIYYDVEKMPATVLLKDIVEELEVQFDELPSFVDLDSGEVVSVSQDLLRDAEDAESEDEALDILAWQEDEWTLAKRIAFHFDRFERLPSKYDVHEWDIMSRFADSVKDRRVAGELQDAIHCTGAFRMFKSAIRRLKVDQQWYAFRLEALEEIARDWCEEHGISCK
jgi:hypothetical protein